MEALRHHSLDERSFQTHPIGWTMGTGSEEWKTSPRGDATSAARTAPRNHHCDTQCVRALASTSPSISRDTRKSLGHGAHCRISGVHHGSGYFFGVLVAPARTRHGPRRGLLRWHDRISACSTLFDCFVETCMIPNSAPGRNTSNCVLLARTLFSAYILYIATTHPHYVPFS
jgi:hypothetical protein